LFDTLLAHVPAPVADPDAPLRALVTNLDASSFLGRIALIRIHAGRLRKGQTVAWLREDGSTQQVRISELLVTEALTRVPAQEASAGDLVAIAGIRLKGTWIPTATVGLTAAKRVTFKPLLPRPTSDRRSCWSRADCAVACESGKTASATTAAMRERNRCI
jgi:GTP-binding protein